MAAGKGFPHLALRWGRGLRGWGRAGREPTVPCDAGLPDRHAPGGEAHLVPRRPVGLGQIAGQPEDRPALVLPIPEEGRPVGHGAGTQDKQKVDVQVRLGLRAAPEEGGGCRRGVPRPSSVPLCPLLKADPSPAVLRPGQEADL